jgi:hypothetical protein
MFIVSMRIMRFYANNLSESNNAILDLRFYGYNAEDAKKFLTEINETGRNYYINQFHVIDTFYPIIYCIFYVTILSYLIKKCFPKNKKLKILLVLPIVGMICDFIENILINHIIKNYDNSLENIVNISSTFTIIKFIMVYTSLALSIIFLMIIVIKKINNSVRRHFA